MIVLDASALLAFLFREKGEDEVGAVLNQACLSTVNLSEVLAVFAREGHDVDAVRAKLSAGLPEIVPFSTEQAELAALLAPKTRALGLSLGDRACLALAMERNITAWTADRVWSRLKAGPKVYVIR